MAAMAMEPEEEGGSSDIFLDLGSLVVESRVKRADCKRGYGEGPHCPPLVALGPHQGRHHHVCNATNLQCKRQENLQKYLLFLWRNSLPACVEVYLAPDCVHGERRCGQADPTVVPEPGYKLLERWTIKITPSGREEANNYSTNQPCPGGQMNCKSLMQAVRSFLHFSQLTAWYSSSQGTAPRNVMYRVGAAILGTHHQTFMNDMNVNDQHRHQCHQQRDGSSFLHHDFDDPDSVSEHVFPAAFVGNKREIIQVSVKTIPRTENLPEVRCHFCGSDASMNPSSTTPSVDEVDRSVTPSPHDDESLRVALMKSRIAAASSSPPPSMGHFPEGAVGGPSGGGSGCCGSPPGASSSSSSAGVSDGLLDPPQRLDRFARRYQSPSRSGSPCAEAPERLFFQPRRRTPDLCSAKDLGRHHPEWDCPLPSRNAILKRRMAWSACSGSNLPSSSSAGSCRTSNKLTSIPSTSKCQSSTSHHQSASAFNLTPEEVREVMSVLRKPCESDCNRTYIVAHCDTSSSVGPCRPTNHDDVDVGVDVDERSVPATPGGKINNKPSDMLLDAILRTGRDKERKPKRDIVDRCFVDQKKKNGKKPIDGNDEDGGSLKVGEQPVCVDAKVIKEKALKYKCLSTSLPVGEDYFSLVGPSKGKVIQPSTSTRVTNQKSPLTKLASSLETSLSILDATSIPLQSSDQPPGKPRRSSSSARRALKFDEDDENSQEGNQNGCCLEEDEENEKVDGLESRLSKRDVPSRTAQARFRRSFDSAASLVFHQRTGLPLTSSPAPCRRGGGSDFGFDSSLTTVHAIKSALFDADETETESVPQSPEIDKASISSVESIERKVKLIKALQRAQLTQLDSPPRPFLSSSAPPASVISSNLLGSFEESVLNGRLEPVSTVEGFYAEIGASGSFCPKHVTVPVTVFFYTFCDNDQVSSPYLGHINLGKKGYRVPKQGTIQVTLFNPLQTVVKMFVIVYNLSNMPANSQTFLRQRTLYMPVGETDRHPDAQKWLRYLIHLRFASTKSGHIYLHTDIRMIVFRKSDVDAAMLHEKEGTAYELRSFTRGPGNPQFSPRK